MNEDECKALAKDIADVDRIIQGHQLGLEWISPDLYATSGLFTFLIQLCN